MREQEDEFTKHDTRIVVVTFEAGFLARQYIAETGLLWPILIDEQRELYRAYGMLAASFWDIWGPQTWWAYLKAIWRGQKFQPSQGDISQRGGDVLIDPAGIVRLHHVGEGPADRPSVATVLRQIDQGGANQKEGG